MCKEYALSVLTEYSVSCAIRVECTGGFRFDLGVQLLQFGSNLVLCKFVVQCLRQRRISWKLLHCACTSFILIHVINLINLAHECLGSYCY